jgi:hypothetical protein
MCDSLYIIKTEVEVDLLIAIIPPLCIMQREHEANQYILNDEGYNALIADGSIPFSDINE